MLGACSVVDGLSSGKVHKKLKSLFGQWCLFSSVEKRQEAFRRWVRVAKQLPSLQHEQLPPPAAGSPYIERMPRDRLRWPRLDLALHLNKHSLNGRLDASLGAVQAQQSRVSAALEAAGENTCATDGAGMEHALSMLRPGIAASSRATPSWPL